jgi:acetolactate synthase I/II/III large subunit
MHHASVYVHNLDLVKYAESCGTKGYRIKRAHDLLFTLKSAREDDKSVSVIAYAVDYFENIEITDKFSRRSLK